MKKIFSILAIAAVCASAFAKSANDEEALYNIRTNSFWSNWFMELNYGLNVNQSSEEGNAASTFDPSFGDRMSHGFALSVGKWHTPGLGLRTKLTGFYLPQIGLTGMGDKQTFFALEEDVLFNLTNLIWGYKEHRVYNGIAYAGAVGGLNFEDGGGLTYGYSLGYINKFRLNDRWAFNLELAMRQYSKDANGLEYFATNKWMGQEHAYSVELGFTYNLSKTRNFRKAVDEDALRDEYGREIAGLNDQLAREQADNARLKDELAKKPKEVVVKEIQKVGVAVPQSIFFRINSSRLSSDAELVNLKAVAECAKENSDCKVYVTGYADSATGTPAYNQKLSERRAETVVKELEKLGVSRDQMVIEAKGGDNTISKAAHNRRVTVTVK